MAAASGSLALMARGVLSAGGVSANQRLAGVSAMPAALASHHESES